MFGNFVGTAIVVWLIQAAIVLYCLWLATRLVQAIETIADRTDRRPT